MRIEFLKIQNFRSIKDEIIPCDNFNIFVGPNGSGKSTVISALNVFFEEEDLSIKELGYFEQSDFTLKEVKNPIKITLTFTDLTPEEIEVFDHDVRQGKLIIFARAEFDQPTNRAKVERFVSRLGFLEFTEYFEAVKTMGANERIEIFKKLCEKYKEIEPATNEANRQKALHDFEAKNPDNCVEIDSGDRFRGSSKGLHEFFKFIEWIYIPAVKDYSSEQKDGRFTAFSKLLERVLKAIPDLEEKVEDLEKKTREEYAKILDENKGLLTDTGTQLNERLRLWAGPGPNVSLEWREEEGRSVIVKFPGVGLLAKEGPFGDQLHKFGHGFQRAYFMALLLTLAEIDQENPRKLLLGCEEPELYQHPPQIRHLSETFRKLSQENSQIFITTHSPLMVSGGGFESIRLVHKKIQGITKIKNTTFDKVAKEHNELRGEERMDKTKIAAKLEKDLQPHLNEAFFSKHVTFVEGTSDVAFLTTCLQLEGLWDKFLELGCQIIPVNSKSNLLRPLLVAKNLGIPIFAMWDFDTANSDKKTEEALFKFYGQKRTKLKNHFKDKHFFVWKKNIEKMLIEDVGKANWNKALTSVRDDYKLSGITNKNPVFASCLIRVLWENKNKSANLIEVCNTIIAHAEEYAEKEFTI